MRVTAPEQRTRKAYLNYRSAGLPGLRELPEHWQQTRLKNICRMNERVLDEDTPPSTGIKYLDIGNMDSQGRVTELQELQFGDAPSRARRKVRHGDTVVSTVRTYLRAVAFMDAPDPNLIVSTGFAVLSPLSEIEPKFLFRMIQSQQFIDWVVAHSEGVAYPAISPSRLSALPAWVPPLEEQCAITAFLDRETAKIDVMIAKKERLIALLEEKRTALISRTVTKGLEPDAPMRDSGLPWLGRIPAHWEVKRLKYQSPQVTVGIVVTPAKYYVDEGVPCLRSLNISQRGITDNDLVFISEGSNELHAKSMIFKGDLVVVRTGQPGTTAVVDERFDGTNCIDLIIVRKSKKFNSTFLSYLANSWFAKVQFETGAGGAIQQHFNIEIAKNLLMLCPPVPEQDRIVAYLDAESQRLDEIVRLNRDLVERLREYRTALISAAVTGRIDVRGTPIERSGLSKRLIEAAEHLFLKKDPEAALTPICNAIDKIAADLYGKPGRQSYQRFIHERMGLITRTAFSGTTILNFNFAIQPLHDEHGRPIKPATTDDDGTTFYSFQQIIYHMVRCALSHRCQISDFLGDSGPGSGQFRNEGNVLYVPLDAIALGLLFSVLSEVSLRHELVGTVFEQVRYKDIPFVDLVGQKGRILELSKAPSKK